MKIAKGHQPVMPFLILNNANEFIKFTQKVFKAEEIYKAFVENTDKIEHAEINIYGCNIIIAEVTENFAATASQLFVYVDDADATFALAVANGCKVINELADQPYGRSAGIKDPFGITWWLTSMK